jgi:hypothetical protein
MRYRGVEKLHNKEFYHSGDQVKKTDGQDMWYVWGEERWIQGFSRET